MIDSIGSGRSDATEDAVGLSRIAQRLVEVRTAKGGVIYIEGPSGSGKSQLVIRAAEAARAAGMCVLDARGRALERDFPFGVAVQLFEEAWHAATAVQRAILRDGPARPAGELLSGAAHVGTGLAGDQTYALIHGLFWLARALAVDPTPAVASEALALVVDDVDCADQPSLHFLAYLAPRIVDLPIVVVLAARARAPSVDSRALGALRAASDLLLLAPPGATTSLSAARPRPVGKPSQEPWMLGPLERQSVEGPRTAAARRALQKSLTDGHRERVVDLAELAWGDGALLEEDEDVDAWPMVAGALMFVDELERALEIAGTATRSPRTAGPPGIAQCCLGWILYYQGRISEALAAARTALAVQREGRWARGLLAACRLAQGRLDEAEAALAILTDGESLEEIDSALLLDLRAQLRLAQMRPRDALADALQAGDRSRGSWGVLGAGVVAWRSTAALARLALGENARSRALAEEELELARERGLQRVVIRDLRVLASAADRTRSLDLLAEAVRVGRAAPMRLEHMNALVDLGAATRRANQRAAARPPLRRGLELAERGGASALARRATEELAATGARSRRMLLSGVKALTPSERRVADLAVGGLTTRQIAQVLFVSPKTVEFHLRHVYRKLDIPSSRAELARSLSSAASG